MRHDNKRFILAVKTKLSAMLRGKIIRSRSE